MSDYNALMVERPPGWQATATRLTDYFDRTAFDAWAAMTSDAPIGVCAGRTIDVPSPPDRWMVPVVATASARINLIC